jgi:hypothetical protein
MPHSAHNGHSFVKRQKRRRRTFARAKVAFGGYFGDSLISAAVVRAAML